MRNQRTAQRPSLGVLTESHHWERKADLGPVSSCRSSVLVAGWLVKELTVHPAQPASARSGMAVSVISNAFRRSSVPGAAVSDAGHIASENAMPFQSTRGANRSADTEALIPATSPATKLYTDASIDVLTAATVTAAAPTDAAETAAAAEPTVQLTQVGWQADLARLTLLDQLPAQLTETQDQLKALQAEMTAAATKFDQQLKEQVQNSIARGDAVKDSCQQQVSALGSTQEVFSQRVWSQNMVVHGFLDTAAASNTAALEHMVKTKIDRVAPGSSISQSITAVTYIGRPGAGN